MARWPVLLAAVTVLLAATSSARAEPKSHEATVRRFVDAYNQRDFGTLERLLAPDAVWYSVEGAKVSVEGADRTAIVASTRDHLKSCTTCRSTLRNVAVAGRRVSVVEEASWTAKDASRRSQSSIAVYEFGPDQRIRAVWYFPVD